jgi:hypothetical protein
MQGNVRRNNFTRVIASLTTCKLLENMCSTTLNQIVRPFDGNWGQNIQRNITKEFKLKMSVRNSENLFFTLNSFSFHHRVSQNNFSHYKSPAVIVDLIKSSSIFLFYNSALNNFFYFIISRCTHLVSCKLFHHSKFIQMKSMCWSWHHAKVAGLIGYAKKCEKRSMSLQKRINHVKGKINN